MVVSAHLYGCAVGRTYLVAATPAGDRGQSVGKPRARKRAKGAPTHVRSWALRPDAGQCREIRTRFVTGVRVFNAVLGEFLGRSRAVKSDPVWQAARELPRRTAAERAHRGAAFRAVEAAHGFTVDAAQSYASSLRKSWVRAHLPAQETQNLGARAFDAVRQWHLGRKGRPRFKSVKRGCIRWLPRMATARCGPRQMRRVGWWGCSGVAGSSSRSQRRRPRGAAVASSRGSSARLRR